MARRLDRILLAAALAVWVAAIAIQLALDLPFGHDEAAYAVNARQLWAGDAPVWLHRSIGTSLLALPGAALDGPELVYRLGPALCSLLVPLGVWALARAAFPERTLGGACAALLATAHPMLLRASNLHSDLPATGLILLGLALVIAELSRPDGPRWWIVGAAPLLAGAFHVRYGAAPALAATALAVAVVYAHALVRRPAPVVVLVLAGAALLALHVPYAIAHTGRPLGVLEAAASLPNPAYLGHGIVTYVTANPLWFHGVVVGPVVLGGYVAGVVLPRRSARLLLAIAVATIVALGLRSPLVADLAGNPDPRFLFLPIALLVVLGVAGGDHLLARVTRRRLALTVAGVVVGIAALGALVAVVTAAEHKRIALDEVVARARAVKRDAAGRPCLVVTYRTPQVAYYSGCRHERWPGVPVDHGMRLYWVSTTSHPLPAAQLAGLRPLPGTDGVYVTP